MTRVEGGGCARSAWARPCSPWPLLESSGCSERVSALGFDPEFLGGSLVLSAVAAPGSHFSGFSLCFAFFSSQNPARPSCGRRHGHFGGTWTCGRRSPGRCRGRFPVKCEGSWLCQGRNRAWGGGESVPRALRLPSTTPHRLAAGLVCPTQLRAGPSACRLPPPPALTPMRLSRGPRSGWRRRRAPC